MRLVIVGAGGHGREVASYVQALRAAGVDIELVGFVDDRVTGHIDGVPVIGTLDEVRKVADTFSYITAVGSNDLRQRFARLLETSAHRFKPESILHPSAIIGSSVEIGEGTCVAPGAVLTTAVSVGRHCILNVKTSISHDCVIGDFANINPGAVVCGNVTIGEGSYIGAGATIIDKIRIGPWTIVGAGAVVTRDLPGHATAVGVPARTIKQSSS